MRRSSVGTPLVERLDYHSQPEPNGGCWLWRGSITKGGYGHLKVELPGTRCRRAHPAHRLSWIAHRGPIPAGLWVLHKCDVRSCINPAHLFLGTHVDNMADMVAKGRHRCGDYRGEKHGSTTLSKQQVLKIRADRRTYRVIGKDYGISPATVCRIKLGDTWTHVQ